MQPPCCEESQCVLAAGYCEKANALISLHRLVGHQSWRAGWLVGTVVMMAGAPCSAGLLLGQVMLVVVLGRVSPVYTPVLIAAQVTH